MDDSNEQDYMHHAYEALSDGDFNQAQVFFKQAIRVNSANEDAWLGLAKTYPGDPERARKCYENVLKINPLNAEASELLAALGDAPADSYETSASPSPAAEPAPAAEALRSSAAPSAGARTTYGGPDVPAPKGIEGAPEKLNADYGVDFVRRLLRSMVSVLSGQGDGSADLPTSWWNAVLTVVLVGLVSGLCIAIAGMRFRSFLTIVTIVTVPLLTIVMSVIAVGAGAFLSHWYLKTYRDGAASLLDHTMTFVRVWAPASSVFAVITLISGLTRDYVMTLTGFLQSFSFNANGLGLIFLIISIAVTAYAALLLHRHWGRIYPGVGGRGLWIAVVIAIVVTSLPL